MHQSPRRFFRRNALNFILAAAMLLIIVLIVFVCLMTFRLFRPAEVEPPDAPDATQVQTPPSNQENPDASTPPEGDEPDEPDEPDSLPDEPNVPNEPDKVAGTVHLAGRELLLRYDIQTLNLTPSDDGGGCCLTAKDGGTARLDLRALDGELEALDGAQQELLARTILQSYYYAAPPDEQVTLTRDEADAEVAFTLSAPAYLDAPAVQLRLRLLQANGQLWYAALLLPEGEAAPALEQAFDDLERETTP